MSSNKGPEILDREIFTRLLVRAQAAQGIHFSLPTTFKYKKILITAGMVQDSHHSTCFHVMPSFKNFWAKRQKQPLKVTLRATKNPVHCNLIYCQITNYIYVISNTLPSKFCNDGTLCLDLKPSLLLPKLI